MRWVDLCLYHQQWELDYNREYAKRMRAKRITAGLCLVAGCSVQVSGRRHCERHARFYANASAVMRKGKKT